MPGLADRLPIPLLTVIDADSSDVAQLLRCNVVEHKHTIAGSPHIFSLSMTKQVMHSAHAASALTDPKSVG